LRKASSESEIIVGNSKNAIMSAAVISERPDVMPTASPKVFTSTRSDEHQSEITEHDGRHTREHFDDGF
jgi:hypothetical protein